MGGGWGAFIRGNTVNNTDTKISGYFSEKELVKVYVFFKIAVKNLWKSSILVHLQIDLIIKIF